MCPVKLTCHIIFAPVIMLMRLVVDRARIIWRRSLGRQMSDVYNIVVGLGKLGWWAGLLVCLSCIRCCQPSPPPPPWPASGTPPPVASGGP